MYTLTIKGLPEVDDKIVIICALLSQQARYLEFARDVEALASERVEVAKLAESYRADADRIQRILDRIYNARTEST